MLGEYDDEYTVRSADAGNARNPAFIVTHPTQYSLPDDATSAFRFGPIRDRPESRPASLIPAGHPLERVVIRSTCPLTTKLD